MSIVSNMKTTTQQSYAVTGNVMYVNVKCSLRMSTVIWWLGRLHCWSLEIK